ncbi:TPA: staphylocoagulase [Staphylococcus aureus]|uniref:staphylocoagulase n=1 Tax=Staphylococcus aureus TaxID=1280 RepID=UPI00229D6A01|nr:staphylocoagulase [Staphylococcus aureus]
MKKQIISLGALAVASSLFTWDNKADAIVTKDYNGKSQVKKESKNGTLIDSRYYWEKIEALEKQFSSALALTDEYQYGGNEYKEAKDKLMERILGEDQYLLKKKIDEYDYYKKWYKATYPNDNSKMYSFHKYNVYYLTMNEYNEITNSLKDAVEKFNNEVRDIQSKNEDLKPYDENTEKQETDKIYEFVSEIDTVFAAYYSHEKFGIHAKELRAKLDIILGDVHNPNRITNERIKKEMMEDLNSIVDDFFMETNQNRPTTIKKYDPNIHDYTKKKENKENFDKLVKETREAVEKADESWKNKTVKKYEETVTKSPFVKEEKKVEEPQLPKVGNQQEVKTTAGKAEETTQPLVKIPQGTITGEIVKGPDFPTMEQNRPSLSDNYTQPTTTNPILEGLEGSSSKLEIKPQGTESTLQGTQGESSDIEVKPQATETTEASQYGPRPQFNKTPKYVKYRDAGTGIREYNDGTFGYEARPRFNKPSETNAYNVTTNQDGTVTYGARPTQNKPSKTNAYNVTTHANGQVSYGARPTYKKPSETNAYNVTTHANGQVSYGARPTQNKASETNAYNVTTHANGQVSYGARPTQNKPSKTNAYNVTTHGNGQVSYGARPTYKKPSETNAYNVTTHADGTATYGPRVTK